MKGYTLMDWKQQSALEEKVSWCMNFAKSKARAKIKYGTLTEHILKKGNMFKGKDLSLRLEPEVVPD